MRRNACSETKNDSDSDICIDVIYCIPYTGGIIATMRWRHVPLNLCDVVHRDFQKRRFTKRLLIVKMIFARKIKFSIIQLHISVWLELDYRNNKTKRQNGLPSGANQSHVLFAGTQPPGAFPRPRAGLSPLEIGNFEKKSCSTKGPPYTWKKFPRPTETRLAPPPSQMVWLRHWMYV